MLVHCFGMRQPTRAWNHFPRWLQAWMLAGHTVAGIQLYNEVLVVMVLEYTLHGWMAVFVRARSVYQLGSMCCW